MQKDNSKSQAGTEVDSEQKDEDMQVSQHNAKPLVVGSQSHGTLSFEEQGQVANKVLAHLYGLTKTSVEGVLEWVKNSLDKCYFLSNPNDLRNS
jgi:hypothetical protein